MRIGNFGAVLLGIIFLAAMVFTGSAMFGWAESVTNLINQIPENMLYSTLAAIVFFVLAVLSFSLVRMGRGEQLVASSATKYGQIRISEHTIGEIASRAGQTVEGIKEVSPGIQPLPEGLIVHIKAVIQPGYVIPQVVEAMQSLVKEDVEKYTGLRVSEVKVMVQSVDTQSVVRIR